jgi:hypothetical protein
MTSTLRKEKFVVGGSAVYANFGEYLGGSTSLTRLIRLVDPPKYSPEKKN